MRNLFVSALILSLVAISAVSQAQNHFYQGASLGYMIWDDERTLGSDDTGDQLGLQLGYEFYNNSAAVELAASTTFNSGPEYDLFQLSLINYLESGKTRPYWLAGLAYSHSGENYFVDEATSGVVGLGVAHFVSDRMEVRGDARVFPALDTDNISGIVDWGLNLAINYHFGDQHAKPAPVAAPAPEPAPVVEEPYRRAAPAPAPAAVEETRSITIRLNVQFETNSADVSGVYGDEIQEVANAMRSQDGIELVLEGHTDSQGGDDYNQSLSQRRVESVKQMLVSQYGIDADRIEAVGYGEARPIADNGTAEGRALNRRVVGVISWEEVVQ